MTSNQTRTVWLVGEKMEGSKLFVRTVELVANWTVVWGLRMTTHIEEPELISI